MAVLGGGTSAEHQISRLSAAAVAQGLRERGHSVVDVIVERDGRWRLPAAEPTHAARAVSELVAAPHAVDVVFVALHGTGGEDGIVQGLLRAAGVSFTGAGVGASAVAIDKERCKEVAVHHGVRTPPWAAGDRESAADPEWVERAIGELGLPLVVKAPREGSSFGIWIADSPAAVREAVDRALAHPDGRVLIERAIRGVEVTCPVVGNRGQAPRTLPLVEIVPADGHSYFDYEAKYEGASDEICPARIPDAAAETVRRVALYLHRLVGCDGLTRSDFIVDARGDVWFLELNTVPGMTAQSLCPLSARTAGVGFAELCERLVRMALGGAWS